MINVATIQGVFSNRFRITGLTPFESQELALQLRAGSLATPIVPVQERTIGPSLGQDNIDRGIEATMVGYLLVVLFIGIWYRAFGVIADIALLANIVMLDRVDVADSASSYRCPASRASCSRSAWRSTRTC